MAFSIHDLLWVPLTGGVSSEVLPAEPQNFYTPLPLVLNFAPGVCRTQCMYAGSPLMRFGVVGGRGVLHPGFQKGYGRRKRRDFLPPSRRKRRDFFRLLRLAGGRGSYIAGFIFPCIALLFRVRFSPKFCQFDIVTTWTEG